jgi:hypothetical protein
MADPKPKPIALDVVQSSNTFPQTGSWSMMDLASAPISGTLGALSRYSAARVDPYAALVGEALCTAFRLGSQGRRNIDTAIDKLKVVGTMGKTLEIGFGMEDIVRAMAKTENGRMCLALCSALTECYSEDMAVEVLLEMARMVNVDGRFMPSSQAWKELLSACAGTLAATKFPLLAEHYMQLPKDDRRLGAYQRFDSPLDKLRSCANPKSIAEAMFNLGSISRGDIRAVTFVGGNDTGWLAAVAQFFFDLKIAIFVDDGSQQAQRHRDCGSIFHMECNPENAQVRIVFKTTDRQYSPSLSVAGREVLITDISKIFEEEGRHHSSCVVSGRLEWKTALSSAFPVEFRKLLHLRETFGGALGSAARLFKGLAFADNFFPIKFRRACTTYCDSSYGPGMVANTVFWFPELNTLKEIMDRASHHNLMDARKDYESSIDRLRENCGCPTCRSNSTGHEIEDGNGSGEDEDELMTPAPEFDAISNEDDGDSTLGYDPDRYCLVVLTETIICLSRTLSNVTLEDKGLLPTRSGFEVAYGLQLNYRLHTFGGRQTLKEIGQIAFCLDFDSNFSFGVLSESENALDVRLKTALSLFCGREVHTPGGQFSAICSHGITAFLGFLRTAASDKDNMSRIHLIPGRILHEGKKYPSLVDRRRFSGFDEELDYSFAVRVHEEDGLWNTPSWLVEETSSGLECSLVPLTTSHPRDFNIRSIGPSSLVSQVSGQTGLIHCRLASRTPYSSGCTMDKRFPPKLILEAISMRTALSHNGKSILMLDCRNRDGCLPTVSATTVLTPEYSTYIVRGECTTCCIKVALGEDRPERPYFCFILLPP